jgi:hypothetical protein
MKIVANYFPIVSGTRKKKNIPTPDVAPGNSLLGDPPIEP